MSQISVLHMYMYNCSSKFKEKRKNFKGNLPQQIDVHLSQMNSKFQFFFNKWNKILNPREIVCKYCLYSLYSILNSPHIAISLVATIVKNQSSFVRNYHSNQNTSLLVKMILNWNMLFLYMFFSVLLLPIVADHSISSSYMSFKATLELHHNKSKFWNYGIWFSSSEFTCQNLTLKGY